MTHQRRRGLKAFVWRIVEKTDSRGNTHRAPERSTEPVTVWIFPQRSAKAEVPGQLDITVLRLGTKVLEGVDLWSRVEILDREWDVVTPPEYHHGTRHTRHYSFDVRERPRG